MKYESADIIKDESIEPKNPVINIEGESIDVIEDESFDPKKINPIIAVNIDIDIIEDEPIDPKKRIPITTIDDISIDASYSIV
jgi:hypothetical protein